MKLIGSVYAFTAFFLLLAVASIAVGTHDAAIAHGSLGVTVSSVMLLVVGVVLVVAAWQLARLSRQSPGEGGVRPLCKPVVLVGFLVTTFLSLYVFVSALGTASAQRPIVIAVALGIAAVGLVGLRFFGSDARVTLPRLGTIALGFVGTLVGASEFWYQNQYVPSRSGRAVAVKVELQRVAEQPAYNVIRATVEVEDVGGTDIAVVGSTYTLTGSRVVQCHRLAAPEKVQPVFDGFLIDPQRSRFMTDVWEKQPADVLAAGKFVGDGKRLDTGVAFTRELVFQVPRHRYQLLRFRAQLFAIPATVQLSQRTLPIWASFPGDNSLYGFWHVDDDSWLHDLTYGRERWVVIRYELGPPPPAPKARLISPDLRVTARFPNPTWSKARPDEAKVLKLFARPQPSDASEPFVDRELALEPVASLTAADHLPQCAAR